jgi:ribosomal-protein-alanine N-acetyltransferase
MSLPVSLADVDTREFLCTPRASLESRVEVQVVILLRPKDEVVGHARLHHIDTPTPEPGVWVKKNAHGRGYGREAVQALFELAPDHLDCGYLKYAVDRRNFPSRRIPKLLGGLVGAEYSYVNAVRDQLDHLEHRIRGKAIPRRRGAGG